MSQLFGMDFSALVNRVESTNRKSEKAESVKNTIGKPEISKKTSGYYEQLKEKYKDVEFVLVEDEQIGNAKQLASNVKSDKDMIVLISESELEAMAADEAVRTKNEQLIADGLAQLPGMKEQLEGAGIEVNSFGMEFNDDGTVSYFAVLDKCQSASSIEELIKKIQDASYEAKADTVMTEEEKMVGQHLDLKF